ncbi:enoyl-CoA hydratase/isomerase family protein [Nocardia grenadensis]|uniref:enoyl-CoA hydratase/isomerase family protein n=1 Tax=Nocardia grenadensis TaxID=931537 RepID=UPI003D934040
MSALSSDYLPSGVVVPTIERPHRRNALDNQTVAELHTVLDEINGAPEVRALVITGAGGACPVSYSRAPWPKRRRSPAIPRSRCG